MQNQHVSHFAQNFKQIYYRGNENEREADREKATAYISTISVYLEGYGIGKKNL